MNIYDLFHKKKCYNFCFCKLKLRFNILPLWKIMKDQLIQLLINVFRNSIKISINYLMSSFCIIFKTSKSFKSLRIGIISFRNSFSLFQPCDWFCLKMTDLLQTITNFRFIISDIFTADSCIFIVIGYTRTYQQISPNSEIYKYYP